jgi:hypothetical protein
MRKEFTWAGRIEMFAEDYAAFVPRLIVRDMEFKGHWNGRSVYRYTYVPEEMEREVEIFNPSPGDSPLDELLVVVDPKDCAYIAEGAIIPRMTLWAINIGLSLADRFRMIVREARAEDFA